MLPGEAFPTSNRMKTAVFVYEVAQVALLPELLVRAGVVSDYTVIALGADIEFLLEEKGIVYRSGKTLRTLSPHERLVMAKELGERALLGSDFSFFSHRGIHLGKLFMPGLQYFLSHFLYFFDCVISALEEESYERVVLLLSTDGDGPIAGAALDSLQVRAFADAVNIVCEKRAIPLSVVSPLAASTHLRVWLGRKWFVIKRKLFHLGIRALNLYIRSRASTKEIRILASEYWKNIAPLMNELPEGELVLIDRIQSRAIGMRGMLKHRMQFMQGEDFVNGAMMRQARQKSLAFWKAWSEVKEKSTLLKETHLRGYPMKTLLAKALERIVREGERAVEDIDGTWAMMERLRPQIVLVRAGISTQIHFALLCEVARLLRVPSLEIQHGVMSMGLTDYARDPSSQYIAEYGPLVREAYEAYQYAPRTTCLDIGSPRFDVYRNTTFAHHDPGGAVRVLHIGPAIAPSSWNDSYDAVEYFQTTARAVSHIQNVHVTIKLRASHAHEHFYREAIRRAYGSVPYTISLFESLPSLLAQTDMVVSCHSTVVLEALLAHRPVVLDASLPIYTELVGIDFKPHREAGALLVAKTPDALKAILERLARDKDEQQVLATKAEQFMKAKYLFHDGKSSNRLTQAIRTLVQKRG